MECRVNLCLRLVRVLSECPCSDGQHPDRNGGLQRIELTITSPFGRLSDAPMLTGILPACEDAAGFSAAFYNTCQRLMTLFKDGLSLTVPLSCAAGAATAAAMNASIVNLIVSGVWLRDL